MILILLHPTSGNAPEVVFYICPKIGICLNFCACSLFLKEKDVYGNGETK